MGGRGGSGASKGSSNRRAPKTVDEKVIAAFKDLQGENKGTEFTRNSLLAGSGWVSIADMREHPLLRDLSRAEQDEVIKRVVQNGSKTGISISTVANLKSLSRREKQAAIHVGGEDQTALHPRE